MIQTTALKRSKPENPYKGIAPPDTVREQTKQVSELSDLLGEYAEFLDKKIDFDQIEKIFNKETISLTPDKIDDFLQQTNYFIDHEDYEENTGIFISQLIQQSYNAGNNNFNLNIKKLKTINSIGAYLQGKEKNPIIITIQGNTGYDCGFKTLNCNFNIEGNTEGDYGSFSQNSIFNIKGNTENNCGNKSQNCNFNIEGNTGYGCGFKTLNCNFNIEGNTGYNCGYETLNCNFNIKGNTGVRYGDLSQNSTFNIEGNTGNNCGYKTQNSIFNIQGDVGRGCYIKAQNNTIITQKIESYLRAIIESSENNTIFLTDSSGHILDFVKK